MSRRRKASPKPARQSRKTARKPARVTAYETQDAPPRPVLYLTAGLFSGIILCGAMVAGILTFMSHASERPLPAPLERASLMPPSPRLQIDETADRAATEASAERLLHTYQWIDKAAGRARIPIEDAMRITASQGWQAPPPEKPQP